MGGIQVAITIPFFKGYFMMIERPLFWYGIKNGPYVMAKIRNPEVGV
jgi:hypothetical protein